MPNGAELSVGEHSNPECYQLEKVPCPAGFSKFEEAPDAHWWTGWPGASCMKCGAEDKDELCVGMCDCTCHEAFWKGLEEYEREHQDEPESTLEI